VSFTNNVETELEFRVFSFGTFPRSSLITVNYDRTGVAAWYSALVTVVLGYREELKMRWRKAFHETRLIVRRVAVFGASGVALTIAASATAFSKAAIEFEGYVGSSSDLGGTVTQVMVYDYTELVADRLMGTEAAADVALSVSFGIEDGGTITPLKVPETLPKDENYLFFDAEVAFSDSEQTSVLMAYVEVSMDFGGTPVEHKQYFWVGRETEGISLISLGDYMRRRAQEHEARAPLPEPGQGKLAPNEDPTCGRRYGCRY
jgi:hypothetical protein